MVLADRSHAARLRTLDAFVLRNHEPDLVADLKFVEVAIDHAVLVEVDLLAVWGLGEPVILKELRDLAMTGVRRELSPRRAYAAHGPAIADLLH